jgi:hypothetical protein
MPHKSPLSLACSAAHRAALCVMLCAGLALAACAAPNFPAAPTATQPSTQAAPSHTSSPRAEPATPTAANTLTAVPPTLAPTAPPAASGVISAANAASLTGEPLTLPEYPQHLAWVPVGAALPPALSPAPDLFAWTNPTFYPIRLNPPALGKPAVLNLQILVLAIAPDFSSLVASQSDRIGIYDLSGSLLHELEGPAPYGIGYSSDGKLLVATSQTEFATNLYDTASGQLVKKLTGFETAAPVYSAGLVPGNRTLYWIARARLVFQDVQSGQMGKELSYQDFIGPLAFSPDGARMALYVENKLFLYSVPDAQQLALMGTSQPLTSLAFSPDGSLLVGGYGPGLQFWDGTNLTPVASLAGPNTFTGIVSFSPDGKHIASLHENNILELWSVK